MKRIMPLLSYFLFFITLASVSLHATTKDIIRIQVTPFKANQGDTVKVEIHVLNEGAVTQDQLRAVLLKPTRGSFELPLQKTPDKPGVYQGKVILSQNAPQGLYSIHAWTGNAKNPSAVGKASFLSGKMVVDFFILPIIDDKDPDHDISQYLQSFQQVSGNCLIAHVLIDKEKAYYPSQICKTDITPGSPKDMVDAILRHGDKKGFPVLLSVSWDMTRNTPSKDRMAEIKSIMKELYTLYRYHPSLSGFYTYQEGSGTYFAPFVREFSDYVKELNPGLLSSCAPYVDDPMLAGYLSIIGSLDIIIYQGMVMASYRPDNRKKYPLRRVKDFCSVGVGGKWLQNKIALTHVELFGYLENRISKDHATTSFENIYPQILSAATVPGADGISFFTYSSNMYTAMKNHPEIQKSHQAVVDGMKAFDLVWDKISRKPNNLTFYIPYSDWVIERWANYYLPALDAFRNLGIPVDILPFAPPLYEDYPYYPYHPNDDLIPRLLKERKILILPNVSGFHLTDSDMIRTLVEQRGVVLAFGPQIPMARSQSFERKELFGLEEIGSKINSSIVVKESIGSRVSVDDKFSIPNVQRTLWKSNRGRVIASFEDGSPAVLINRYGKGTVVSVVLDAATAAQKIPQLVRDVIDYAMAERGVTQLADVLGTNENVDVAVVKIENGFRVAVINHNNDILKVTIKALNITDGSEFEWYDLISTKKLDTPANQSFLDLQIPGLGFICIEFRQLFI
jgi:hypothetical protein